MIHEILPVLKFYDSILFLEKTPVLKKIMNDGSLIGLKGKLVLTDFYNTAVEPVSDGILNWQV